MSNLNKVSKPRAITVMLVLWFFGRFRRGLGGKPCFRNCVPHSKQEPNRLIANTMALLSLRMM
jgi:hypothetical protein